MSNASYARQIKRTDELIAKFEDKAIASVELSMDRAFRDLEREFRRKWVEGESLDLGGKERAMLLIGQIRDLLRILPSDSADVEKLYADLINDSAAAGIEIGNKGIELVGGFKPASTVRPNLEAAAFQAQDAASRLYRYSTDFQLAATQSIQQGLIQGSSFGKVADQLRRHLGIAKGRAETIARTESMAAMDSATRDSYAANGISYVQRIGTQDNRICPYCAARVGNVYPLDKAPALLHPRDRCYNAPFSQDWVDAGLIDTAWLKQHKADVLAKLDGNPDYGASPFERINGIRPPKSVWTIDGGWVQGKRNG